jgi:hypothetical protein
MIAHRPELADSAFGNFAMEVDGEPFVMATPRRTLPILAYLRAFSNDDRPGSQTAITLPSTGGAAPMRPSAATRKRTPQKPALPA